MSHLFSENSILLLCELGHLKWNYPGENQGGKTGWNRYRSSGVSFSLGSEDSTEARLTGIRFPVP